MATGGSTGRVATVTDTSSKEVGTATRSADLFAVPGACRGDAETKDISGGASAVYRVVIWGRRLEGATQAAKQARVSEGMSWQ